MVGVSTTVPLWVSTPQRLTGNPEPFWESHHGGDYYHGDRCGRFAHKIGEPFYRWQWDAERKILATRPDGLWSHPDVCLLITRQQGKSQLITLRILYGLFFLGEKIIYTAQRWQTVEDVYDRIVAMIDRRPSLRRRLDSSACPDGHTKAGNHGEIHLLNGASLHMGPRTKAVGRGETKIDLAIFDEAYDVKEAHTTDLTGAQNASDNPQTIFVSTAAVVDLHPHCQVLATMRRNGLRHEPDLYAAEWRAPDGMARDDPQAWRLAQPSHGATVRAREVSRELRRARTATLIAMFNADYLGWGSWPPDPDEAKCPIPLDVWDKLVAIPELVGDVCLAVERTLDLRWWCIAAGQRTRDGRVHVEVGYWRAVNIGQAAAAVLELVELWDPVAIAVDSHSRAHPIAPYLHNQGIECVVTSTPKLALYTQGFVDSVMSGDVCHVGQKLLRDGLEGGAMRELPRGDVVWDEAESGAALAPVKAVTLAHGAVLEFAAESRPAASPSTGTGAIDLDADLGADALEMRF